MLNSTSQLIAEISSCDICAETLPLAPKPVIQVHSQAKILIAGQAPGLAAHNSGKAFDDASGRRLRQWMSIDEDTFYNEKLIAILPMGFCYPGKATSGDAPPSKICAKTWRKQALTVMPHIKLTLLLGKHAQNWHLKNNAALTETVKTWKAYAPRVMPLPHPSPRNNIWLKQNPWFGQQVLPQLKKLVANALAD